MNFFMTKKLFLNLFYPHGQVPNHRNVRLGYNEIIYGIFNEPAADWTLLDEVVTST